LLQSVRTLKKAKDAVNFLEPVNVVLFNIPHYAQIITKPMDLGTVEHKLLASDPRGPPKDKSKLAKWDESKGTYKSVSEVVADVRQIWENTRKFNGPAHVVSQMASKLDDMFERQLKNLPAEVRRPV
jgi:bromodomain-containing factor 1